MSIGWSQGCGEIEPHALLKLITIIMKVRKQVNHPTAIKRGQQVAENFIDAIEQMYRSIYHCMMYV
jgi:hypothetical protein